MSLKIWLPMNRDLRNQGLLNNTITNSGATYSSDGKLGGCYIFDGVDDSLAVGNLSTMVETDFSFACWFYKDEWGSKGYETIFGGPSGFELESKVSSTNSPVLKLYNWGGGSCTYELSKWNHIVFTRNSTETKLYLNGELKVTGSAGTIPNNNYFVGSWNSATQQNFKGKMCDVRIYDHCLSPMEIKQLSQGLVLHYPLTDTYVEATTNLITTEDCLSSTCYNGATSKYGYGANTDIYKTVTTYDGRKGTKVYMGTNGNNCYPYVYVNNMYTSNGTNSPEYKTLSFDYYTTVSTSICPYKLGSGAGTATYIVNANGTERTGTGTNSVTIPIVPNTWNHIEVTFHGTTDADAQWGYIQNQPAHVSNTNNFWFFANMQLETKDHATGYAGAGGTRSPNTVYDCSGFCNNGAISGNLVINNDTPKYRVSTQFNGTQYVETLDEISTVDSTIAVWVNTTLAANGFILECRNSSGSGKQPIYQYTNGSIQTGGSGKYVTTSTGLLVANTWIHLAIVQDGNSILVYKNGQLFQTISCTNSPIIRPVLGARYTHGGGFTGQLSDLRIYATALSPSDVKSLYQNCATIDPDGTIRGQIRS